MGWSPLLRASSLGFDRIVDALLAAKTPSSVRLTNKVRQKTTPGCPCWVAQWFLCGQHGKTALHCACAGGFMKIVQSLLLKGADPGKADKGGRTPVDEALDAECVPASLSCFSTAL
jgi:hypothetical protein